MIATLLPFIGAFVTGFETVGFGQGMRNVLYDACCHATGGLPGAYMNPPRHRRGNMQRASCVVDHYGGVPRSAASTIFTMSSLPEPSSSGSG